MGDIRRLIVFDLDGTLVDSRQDLADSANALILERGGHPLPDGAIVQMVGEGAARLVRRALEAAGLPFDEGSVLRFLALYDERMLRTTRLYPGMLAVVERLAREAPVAVLTNKPLAHSAAIVRALGLEPLLSITVGGDGPFPRKPDPTSLRHLMERHLAPPERTLLVGDSRIDFETALAAGTRVCLARYGFGYERFPVEALRGDEGLVDSPAEIPAAVHRLLGLEG